MGPDQTVNHKMDILEGDFSNQMDIKLEEHQIKVESKLEIEYSAADNINLENHLLTHNDKKSYHCSLCEKCYVYESGLKMHRLAKHNKKKGKNKSYQCGDCDNCFVTKGNLIQHQKEHVWEKKYKCCLCDLYVSTTSALVKHQKLHKVYKCKDCGECFAEKSDAIIYQDPLIGTQPNQCSHGSLTLLKHHYIKKQRDKMKPHQCQHCGKCFADKVDVIRHQRTQTGVQPYKCSHCQKYFAFEDDMVKHKITHTGEKPNQCMHCGKSYTKNAYLVKHEKTHNVKGVVSNSLSANVDPGQVVKHEIAYEDDYSNRIYVNAEEYPMEVEIKQEKTHIVEGVVSKSLSANVDPDQVIKHEIADEDDYNNHIYVKAEGYPIEMEIKQEIEY